MYLINRKLDEEDIEQINQLTTELERKKTIRLLNSAWQHFIDTGQKLAIVRNKIFYSWQQSHLSGINTSMLNYQFVTDHKLDQLLIENRDLINCAKKVMECLLSYNSQGHINLTTADGVTLHSCGLDITPIGSILTEKIQGTNCTGRCIIEKKLVYVLSVENYSLPLRNRNMDCAAAPIINANNQILAILTLTMGANELFHYHTLGTVQAAAGAISQQIQLQVALEKEKVFIESLNAGTIIIDNNESIYAINSYARRLFNINELQYPNRSLTLADIAQFATNTPLTLQKISHDHEQEITLILNDNSLLFCQISVTQVQFNHYILSITEKKRMHKITQKIIGAQARYHFDSIITQSAGMYEAINIAKVSSQSRSTVLILGESGTGKEMFAQAIHNASDRRDGPFIAINCGSLPRDLVQSELFGYVDGAFTGAKRGGVTGKFELANSGTIFLDEIGDMPLEAQINLLRVIQENEITRIGSHLAQKIDVKIIAATNRDLQQSIKNGSFRQDLYYRLNVISINIPPLRERIDDILILLHYFTTQICHSVKRQLIEFSSEALNMIVNYRWPGNVRELENMIERVIHLTKNRVIHPNDLPAEIIESNNLSAENNPVKRLLANEMKEIIHCLDLTKGNLRKSALLLGISRGTLYNKLKKLAIDVNDYR